MVLSNEERVAELRGEVRVFAVYLVGTAPELDLVERYVAASTELLGPGGDDGGKERAVVRAAVRDPRRLPYLDGACGLWRPDSLLRKKLLITAALLEATPRHADSFLAVRTSTLGLGLRLAGLGIASAFHALVGAWMLRSVERSAA